MNAKPASMLFIAFCILLPIESNAHDCFQEPMEERYGLRTVSCKTCHPNNKDRSIHNEFGKLFEKELLGKELTKKFNEAEKKGEEAVAEYEKEMVQHFIVAMKAVEKKSMTFEDLIKHGLLNGVRLEKSAEDDK